jgi:hypothetical protein
MGAKSCRHLVKASGTILDLAAGNGRHARYFKGLSHPVVALDRDVSGLQRLDAEIIAADLENGSPWPLGTRAFDGIVVTNAASSAVSAPGPAPWRRRRLSTRPSASATSASASRATPTSYSARRTARVRRRALQALAYACGEVAEPKRAITQRVVAKRLIGR